MKVDYSNIFTFAQRLVIASWVALFFSFTIFVFGPYELFYTNRSEFWFGPVAILPIVIALFVIAFFAILVGTSFFKKRWYDYVIALAFAGTLCFYVQGNFMFVDYGTLDGSLIEWNHYVRWALVNTAIWIAICVAVLLLMNRKRSLCYQLIKLCSILIVLIQVSTLGVLWIADKSNHETGNAEAKYYLSPEDALEASQEENIIIFVLDAFDSAYFKTLIAEKPEYKDKLNHFVYYPDTVGGATRTKLAMPYILTGEAYTENVSYLQYLKQSYEKTPLYRELKEHNFEVGIYTNTVYVDPNQQELITNLVKLEPKVDSYIQLAKPLMKSIAFKYMPHMLKRYFGVYTEEFNQSVNSEKVYTIDDAGFYNRLKKETLHVNPEKKAFRLYHLQGAHPPYTLNELAQEVPKEESSLEQQIEGSLQIVIEYMEQLKSKGIYDNTTLLILADHGVGLGQNPLLLIKEKNAKTRFEISDASVSFDNLRPTLLSLLSDHYSELGIAFDEVKPDTLRERTFYADQSTASETIVREYRIGGKADDMDQIFAVRDLNLGNDLNRSYRLGTKLNFDAQETAKPYKVSGFAAPEMEFTWSEGTASILEFDIQDQLNSDLKVEIGLKERMHDIMMVDIYANGQLVSEKPIASNTVSFVIPVECMTSRNLILEFVYGNADSPSNVTGNPDGRILALAFQDIRISEK